MVQNRGSQLTGVCAWMVSMAFVSVLLRVYVRVRMVKAFGWDDALMIFAMTANIMFASCAIAGVHYGTGRHYKDLEPEGIYMALRYWWLCYIAYAFAMIAAKLSIGLFLLRITPQKIHYWIINTVMGLTCLTGAVFLLVTVFQCSPVNYFWGQALGAGGSCINIYVIIGLTYLYSGISAICDFTFGLLPVILVWNLNMSKNAKVALIPILSMACVASVAVCVRMGFVMRFVTNDFLYDTVDIAIWSDIEQGLAITAGSLATLRPLYRVAADWLGRSTRIYSNPMKLSGGETPTPGTGFSDHHKRKRSGPFSIMTRTHNNDKEDEEYVLENCKAIQIEGNASVYGERSDDSFQAWAGTGQRKGDSEETLRRNEKVITKVTNVYSSIENGGKY